MGKKSDKLYVTHGEWQREYGGKSAITPVTVFTPLVGFDVCWLTRRPHQHPVASPDGCVFDLESIIPFLQKYHNVHPITGSSLQPSELIKLHFHRNAAGNFHCPVTFKELSPQSSRVVFIRTSGNVYAWEAVERLNIKAKYWKDLLTDEAFKRSDIIEIQNPPEIGLRDVSKFYFIQKKLGICPPPQASASTTTKGGMASRILNELQSSMPPTVPTSTANTLCPIASTDPKYAAHYSTGRAAASLTSTALTPITVNQAAELDRNSVMYASIKNKGYCQLQTNFGDLNLELFCDLAPLACHNFILLAKSGYYNQVRFHRCIPGFMIQGGDPEGTGKGGQSFWKKPFRDEIKPQLSHAGRGIVSMANRGKDSNGSQFFITFDACKHLDGKHTIFGKLVGGMAVLDKMESVPAGDNDCPTHEIIINEAVVFVDPFADYEKTEQRRISDVSSKKRKTGEC